MYLYEADGVVQKLTEGYLQQGFHFVEVDWIAGRMDDDGFSQGGELERIGYSGPEPVGGRCSQQQSRLPGRPPCCARTPRSSSGSRLH